MREVRPLIEILIRERDGMPHVLLCATVGYFLTTEFSSELPGGVDADRYARALARMLGQS